MVSSHPATDPNFAKEPIFCDAVAARIPPDAGPLKTEERGSVRRSLAVMAAACSHVQEALSQASIATRGDLADDGTVWSLHANQKAAQGSSRDSLMTDSVRRSVIEELCCIPILCTIFIEVDAPIRQLPKTPPRVQTYRPRPPGFVRPLLTGHEG